MSQDLIKRLEAATGPKAHYDVEIALAVGFWPKDKIDKVVTHENGEITVWFTDTYQELCPDFTTSIDAAVALAERVLPDWEIEHIGQNHNKKWWVTLYLPPIGDDAGNIVRYNRKSSHFNAPSPAIAICIAILKAKEAIPASPLAPEGGEG